MWEVDFDVVGVIPVKVGVSKKPASLEAIKLMEEVTLRPAGVT